MNENVIKKAKFYFEKQQQVHIVLDWKFYNGLINKLEEDHLILNDKKLGDTLIFFQDIKDIEPYKEEA